MFANLAWQIKKFQNSLPTDENLNQGTSSKIVLTTYLVHRADDGKDSAGDSFSSAITTTFLSSAISNIDNILIKDDEGLFQVGKTHRVVLSAKSPAHKTGRNELVSVPKCFRPRL